MAHKTVPLLLVITLIIGAELVSSTASLRTDRASASTSDLILSLTVYATGLESPIGIANAGPGDDRLFVIEKAGRIKIVQPDGSVASTPYLDITDRVNSSANEQGLLGLTFHPNYAENGYFFVNYTHSAGPDTWTRISRFQRSANPDAGNQNSEDVLLTVSQPAINHNAGDIHFGPDGFLYIPLGDGGGGGDQNNNAQSTDTLLGKIVRIDVDSNGVNAPDCVGGGSGHYTVPAANPFLADDEVCDEIWALGLRNPWQSSFDRLTGDLYVGDVGQGDWEEVDFQAADSIGGENYGWRCYEGNHDYNLVGCEQRDSYVFPIFEYSNPPGDCASVIGGHVYRGTQFPALYGHYVLTDLCSGTFWTLERSDGGWLATEHENLGIRSFVAFGEDHSGELYVANINSGNIYHLSAIDTTALQVQTFIPITKH